MSLARVELRRVGPLSPPSDDEFQAVLDLAKRHSATLGFLRDQAFADRVRNGTLILATRGSTVVGYCMYDTPRTGHIKLVQVCVDVRGEGLGKQLIDAATAEHPEATGVLAWCRRDYGLAPFWTSVGLTPQRERPGRAVSGSVLTLWWRPLGGLNLLEEAALESQLPRTMYDTNVVSDLYSSPSIDRPFRSASLALLTDWVQAETVAVVSPQVDIELDRIPEPEERRRQWEEASALVRLRSTSDRPTIHKALLDAVPAALLATDTSLHVDLLQVADALTNRVEYFVTNDSNLIDAVTAALPAGSELRVLRPHQLIDDLRLKATEPRYRSRLIETADLEWRPATDFSEQQLIEAFTTQERSEKGKDFVRHVREALAWHPATTRVLSTPDGTAWALIADRSDASDLVVSLLRVRRGHTATTVALQLARHLRQTARDSGLPRVNVEDPALAPVAEQALLLDGFHLREPGGFSADVLDVVRTLSSFVADVPQRSVSISATVRVLERRYWPLTISDADVPTYLVPIQPRFMEALLQIDRGGLIPTGTRALGLSREHVYYSRALRSLPPTGARILWYVTHDKTGTFRQLRSRSRSLGFETLPADRAFEAHSDVGVFRKRHVVDAQRPDGTVSVIRFEDTEQLEHPIGGAELISLLTAHGVKPPILSFRSVPPALYDDVIRMQNRSAS